ncbi:hypothetical protein SLEP1_g3921 [Rubroshorea leprosula]|uniref:Uncharacterized protein n=1 Tax=Rubroshorea leprosula TaxID=152421 RepID=A0AAV5HSS1_9ROSI|nr:hypothetical protein SLEP1_g3921 [Rubroshorea leprosula]
MNSDVCVKGTIFNDESDYYGSLKEIIEFQYFDSYVHQSVILFKYEPFILTSQAQQVFYARYPSQNPCRKGWFAACKIRARAIIGTSSLINDGNVYYQDDDPPMPQLVQPSIALNDHVSLASQGGEQVVISKVMQLPYVAEEECVGEDDDEEEEFDGTETSEEEEQPTVTQPPLDDNQYTSDDATMEEDTKEHNLEAELDAEFVVLDPKLDAKLEEELSCAVSKTRRGMDKGDDALADPSQRKVNDAHQKYVEKHGPNKDSWPEWDLLIGKEVVGPPKKGQMKGMSTLQDLAKHGIPWLRYDMSEASSSTTKILMTQTGYLSSAPPQIVDSSFGGFRPDHLPSPT